MTYDGILVPLFNFIPGAKTLRLSRLFKAQRQTRFAYVDALAFFT